jgi:hypothetical protein
MLTPMKSHERKKTQDRKLRNSLNSPSLQLVFRKPEFSKDRAKANLIKLGGGAVGVPVEQRQLYV